MDFRFGVINFEILVGGGALGQEAVGISYRSQQ